MEPTVTALVVIVALVVVAGVGVPAARRRRNRPPQRRPGPGQSREVAATGAPGPVAEERLDGCEQRLGELAGREPGRDERPRRGPTRPRGRHDPVDGPLHVVPGAEDLVDPTGLHGHPVQDSGRRTEEVSVVRPDVVQRYRDARAVKEATEHGPVDTEQQRRAVRSHRTFVAALLDRSTEREEHTR